MCEDNLIESLKVEYQMVQLAHKNWSSMSVRDSSISSFFSQYNLSINFKSWKASLNIWSILSMSLFFSPVNLCWCYFFKDISFLCASVKGKRWRKACQVHFFSIVFLLHTKEFEFVWRVPLSKSEIYLYLFVDRCVFCKISTCL